MAANVHQDTSGERHIQLDDFGFFPFMIATIAGMMIAKIVIPLPAGASFTLGTSGGPLLAGLVMGHFMHVGPVSITVPKPTWRSCGSLDWCFSLWGRVPTPERALWKS